MRQTFVLVGPHAGKDLAVSGHEFKGGQYHFEGSGEQIETLTRIFGFYSAVPEGEALEHAINGPDDSNKQPQQPQQPQEPAKSQTNEDGSLTNEALAQVPLAEAIGKLDPAVDGDWTSSNLPSLDALEKLMGKKPSRDDVNAVADGYTRAKAKAARS
jgi:hypothetical protein